MNNYAKGANYERDFCKRMEAKGYLAIRSAGSHKQVDVVLLPLPNAEPLLPKPTSILAAVTTPYITIFACQLKRVQSSEAKEKEEFRKLKLAAGVQKLWVSKKDREEEKWELIE